MRRLLAVSPGNRVIEVAHEGKRQARLQGRVGVTCLPVTQTSAIPVNG